MRASDRKLADIAGELGVHPQTLSVWVQREQADRGERSDVLTSDERAELRRLRRENAELQLEKEILKEGRGFFAKETGS